MTASTWRCSEASPPGMLSSPVAGKNRRSIPLVVSGYGSGADIGGGATASGEANRFSNSSMILFTWSATRGPVQGLVVEASLLLDCELGFTPGQENGLLQSPLGASSWSSRLDSPLVVPGLAGLACYGEYLCQTWWSIPPGIQDTRSGSWWVTHWSLEQLG